MGNRTVLVLQMVPLLAPKAVYIHKLKTVPWHLTILSLSLLQSRPSLNLQSSLFLQLSHCGAADWATGLWRSSLSGSEEPFDTAPPFSETPWVSACSGSLTISIQISPRHTHIQCTGLSMVGHTGHCNDVGQGQKSSVHLLMCEVNPTRKYSPLFPFHLFCSVWQYLCSVSGHQRLQSRCCALSTHLLGSWSSKTVHN